MDSNISWSAHTDSLCKKVSSRIGLLKRTMPFLSIQTAKMVYKSIIESLFDYCGVVWDVCGEVSTTRIQPLQNRAARVILSTDYKTPSVLAREKLCLKTLEQRKHHKAILMYKCLNNDVEGIDNNFLRHMDRHNL